MKKIILASAALAVSATFALAAGHEKTIRMGTEGAYPPITSSTMPAKSTGSSVSWAMSCASAPN